MNQAGQDVDGLAAPLRDDVRWSMPLTPGLYVGRDTVVNDRVESMQADVQAGRRAAGLDIGIRRGRTGRGS